MERQFAHRVRCPSCGTWAQLRVAYFDNAAPIAVLFSCRDQTDRRHTPPTTEQMLALIPSNVELPQLDAAGHLVQR